MVWNIADLGHDLRRWSAWQRFSTSHLYGWGFHGSGVFVDSFSPSAPKIQGPRSGVIDPHAKVAFYGLDEVAQWQKQWLQFTDREFFGFGFHRGPLFEVKGDDIWYMGSGWSFHVPYWAILLVTLPLPMNYVWVMLRRERRRNKGQCGGCGYDLRASAERCPECGTPIEAGFLLLADKPAR